jgi:hypothetical protein
MYSAGMLSISECRKLIGETAKDLSDEQVTEIRDALYELASIALDAAEEKRIEAESIPPESEGP